MKLFNFETHDLLKFTLTYILLLGYGTLKTENQGNSLLSVLKIFTLFWHIYVLMALN